MICGSIPHSSTQDLWEGAQKRAVNVGCRVEGSGRWWGLEAMGSWD